MTDSKECPKGEHAALDARVTRSEDDIQQIWKTIERIRNRPPTWVVFAMSGASGIIGSLLTLLAVMVKIHF